ncbi:hypothetical protein RirG_031640 [Rhizophagus irregularis DAOM 197198w]|uniref:Uncharacterized protein n=1 Tax=Rhizophagus irregularis (strain DAOM 197198w) TaxID=1432141 RepID=A0A015K4B6_RHIIW|nr:hypothetical protein RirG_031640 [Rhizophagus irregularis DAOM 197198w]
MQKVLYVEDMVAANGDDGVELAGSIVIFVGETIDGLAEFYFESSLQVGICILGRAGAYHEQETGPLEAKRLRSEAGDPPLAIFL